MNNTTRCKFRCDSIERNVTNGKAKLSPVYSSDINTEDHKYCNATPGGKLELNLYPAEKSDFFTPGKFYFIDITEAD